MQGDTIGPIENFPYFKLFENSSVEIPLTASAVFGIIIITLEEKHLPIIQLFNVRLVSFVITALIEGDGMQKRFWD